MRISLATLAAALLLAPFGCRQDMHDQPKYDPLEASDFFADGRASRPLVAGTVARGHRDDDLPFATGLEWAPEGAKRTVVGAFPLPVTPELLRRGRERYDIFCSPCHGLAGDGEGMIVERGLRRPPSFHVDRLRQARVGHFFDVMTNGFGAMLDYRAQIPPRDRWAIVAYVRALQLSQGAKLEDVPASERGRLETGTAPTGAPAEEGERRQPAGSRSERKHG